MEGLLVVSLVAPLVVALVLAARAVRSEAIVAHLAQGAAALSAATALGAVGVWIAHGAVWRKTPAHVLFARGTYSFRFELVIDLASVVFLLLVQFTTGMVLRFSRFYLHREPGFARFFATVLMFQAAMGVLTLAGNLDLMFAGWEVVGLSSFLLIAFYRERHSAVRNALKTYSVYRVADMGMLLAAALAQSGSHRELGLLLLLAAIGKSAQFPFSFWVPRAMEGPTPSSALFYGALSVHAGAYLLLRTFDVWSDVGAVKWCIGAVGLLTAALCSLFGRVQPTIKGQVGYASVTQVGLIFVELALGLRGLALAHTVCNALLRCYQLLVSPSTVAYLLRRQASAGSARVTAGRPSGRRLLPRGWAASLYVFALSEGYLKEVSKRVLWSPFRRLGRWVLPRWVTLLAVGLLGALVVVAFAPRTLRLAVASVFTAMALVCSGCGVGSWRQPLESVAWVSASSLAVAAAVLALDPAQNGFAALSYATAIAIFLGLGLAGAASIVPWRGTIARYAGFAEARPLATTCALVSALGVAGFPLLPTFVGEDLLLHDTLRESGVVSTALTGILALNGYLAVRNFAFAFLGQHRPEGVAEWATAGRSVPAMTDGIR